MATARIVQWVACAVAVPGALAHRHAEQRLISPAPPGRRCTVSPRRYRSEERLFWDKVYDPANTLGPLFMVSNRCESAAVQLDARACIFCSG